MITYNFADGKSLTVGDRVLIMGILNLTPDSFWDGGKYKNIDRALRRLDQLIAEGADIVDVGAESTRPGAAPISADEEQERLIPILRELIVRSPLPVSIDTYKPSTAKIAAEMGAHILNDVWGLQYADETLTMAKVAFKYDLPVVVMHNRRDKDEGKDIISVVRKFWQRSLQIADVTGLSREKIIFDPGIGFGKNTAENLKILRCLDDLTTVDGKIYPMLLGVSRKNFIGETLGLPKEERLEATGATCLWGISRGAKILRVHDVAPIVRMCRMWEAIRG